MRKFINILGRSVLALLLVSITALAAIVVRLVWHYEYEIDLPDHRKLATISATGRICSSGGERIVVPLAAIPPMVRNAFLAAEEPDFYARSPITPFTEITGYVIFDHKPTISAISTAVVRCLMSLSPDCCRTQADWHVGNAILMHRVERDLPKDLIFELYLNEVSFGRSVYGVGAAANAYFRSNRRGSSLHSGDPEGALPHFPQH